MKKLPEIYKNNINKNINNNKKMCILKNVNEEIKETPVNIEKILSKIFNGIGYSYNIPILIETKDKKYETSLITRTKNNVVTLDNDIIPINEIVNIKILKK